MKQVMRTVLYFFQIPYDRTLSWIDAKSKKILTTKTVQKFSSYFEHQDTFQNAVFVIKNWYFVIKTAFLTTQTAFWTKKKYSNSVFNDKMPFKMNF